jgi:acetylornithine deacetylase/succinyl-diaminopimelate desuccinylase family protein
MTGMMWASGWTRCRLAVGFAMDEADAIPAANGRHTAAGALSAEEVRLISMLDERQPELIEFARTLVRIPSPNPPGNERAVAVAIAERLREFGINVAISGPTAERSNLIARLPGSVGRPALVLSGHLDTKPPGRAAEWTCDPFEGCVRDGRLYGLGACDMKGAVAALVYAVAAVKALGSRKGDLALVLTADEEGGSSAGAAWLARRGLPGADAALIAEPSGIESDWEQISVVSRGAAIFRITVHGDQLHSSLTDRNDAINATVMMARLISHLDERLRTQLRFEPHPLVPGGPTVNIGVTCRAGVSIGINPGMAEFESDIRTLPGMTRSDVEHDLRAALRAAEDIDSDLRADLELHTWVDAASIPAFHPIVTTLQGAAAAVLGTAPPLGANPGGTDASYFHAVRIPTIPAFGPGRIMDAHRPDESVPVEAIGQAARIYALMALRYVNP